MGDGRSGRCVAWEGWMEEEGSFKLMEEGAHASGGEFGSTCKIFSMKFQLPVNSSRERQTQGHKVRLGRRESLVSDG